MKTKTILTLQALIFLLAMSDNILAQNVAITDDSLYSAHSSAMLDIKSDSKGLLIPRLTKDQRDGIQNTATGLMIFQTDQDSGFWFNAGSLLSPSWVKMSDASSSVWTRATGNNIILSNLPDSIGIGVTKPEEKLEVRGNMVLDTVDPFIRFNQDSLHAGKIQYFLPPEVGYLHLQAWDMNNFEATGVVIRSPGQDVGIGTLTPAYKLDVMGTAKVNGFVYPNGAQDDYVLTADQNGVATWKSPPIKGGGGTGWIPRFTAPRQIGNSGLKQFTYININGPTPHGTEDTVYLYHHLQSNEAMSVRYKITNKYTGTDRNSGVEMGMGMGTVGDSVSGYLMNYEYGSLILGSNGKEAMRTDTAGYVGIGVREPEEKLHVRGSLMLDSSNACIFFRDTSLFNQWAVTSRISQHKEFLNNRDVSYLQLQVSSSHPYVTTDTGLVINEFCNYVGLGTRRPSEKLDVRGNIALDTAECFILFSDKQGQGVDPLDVGRIRYERSPQFSDLKRLHLQAWDFNWLERPGLVIASPDENVGVGILDPEAKLHVYQVYGGDAFRVDDETYDDTPFIIDNEGNVGIGIESPEEKLHIDGNILADDDMTISSDNNGQITIESGSARVIINKYGDIEIESQKDVNISTGQNVNISANSKINMTSAFEIKMQCGASVFKATPTGISLQGGVIRLNGGDKPVSGITDLVNCPPNGGTGTILTGNPTVLMGTQTAGESQKQGR